MARNINHECPWTRRICKELESHGTIIRAIVATRMQAPGWPDRWIAHKFWHGHLEFKRLNRVVTPLQKIIIRRINAQQPGTAFVIRQPALGVQYLGWIETEEGIKLSGFMNVKELLSELRRLHDEARVTTTG